MMAAAMNAGRSLLVLLQLNKSEVKPFEICHFCLLSNYVVVRLDKNLGFHCSIQLPRKRGFFCHSLVFFDIIFFINTWAPARIM